MALVGDTSDLDTLMYGGYPMLPERDSYSFTDSFGVEQTDISGGFVRQSLLYFNAPYQVDVKYNLVTAQRYNYLKMFIDAHKAIPFIAYMCLDSIEVEPYVVDIIDAPEWETTGFSGTCKLSLQVQPSPDYDYRDFVLNFAPEYGDYFAEFADLINQTVNQDLPEV